MKKTAIDKYGQMLQQIFVHDPWKLLITCIMLNQTSGTQVHNVIYKFFERFPGPIAVKKAGRSQIERMIRSLGLSNRRTETIKRFSHDYLNKDWKRPSECYGIGKYAEDSWYIFIDGNLKIKPDDKELKAYLKLIK